MSGLVTSTGLVVFMDGERQLIPPGTSVTPQLADAIGPDVLATATTSLGGPVETIDYEPWSVAKLRSEIRKRGLQVTGKRKAELIAALVEDD